jgi:hypothetical protein
LLLDEFDFSFPENLVFFVLRRFFGNDVFELGDFVFELLFVAG